MSKPIAQIKLWIEFEVEYDPFKGRTPEEFAEVLHEDLHVALNDFRENDVKGIFSDVESVNLVSSTVEA